MTDPITNNVRIGAVNMEVNLTELQAAVIAGA